MKSPKIYYVSRIIPPYRGMTIPPIGIFIKNNYKNNQKIINHELIHWQQYQKLGLIKFYFKYIQQFIIYGYDNMSMEIEARYEEDEYTKYNYSSVYHVKSKRK